MLSPADAHLTPGSNRSNQEQNSADCLQNRSADIRLRLDPIDRLQLRCDRRELEYSTRQRTYSSYYESDQSGGDDRERGPAKCFLEGVLHALHGPRRLLGVRLVDRYGDLTVMSMPFVTKTGFDTH